MHAPMCEGYCRIAVKMKRMRLKSDLWFIASLRLGAADRQSHSSRRVGPEGSQFFLGSSETEHPRHEAKTRFNGVSLCTAEQPPVLSRCDV